MKKKRSRLEASKRLKEEDLILPTMRELDFRQRKFNRVLGLEGLIELNARIDDDRQEVFTAGHRRQIGLDADAYGGIFRLLLMNAIDRRDYSKGRVPLRYRRLLEESDIDSELYRLIAHIAAVISQTYADLGDGAPIADDDALSLIREALLGYDETLIDRQRSQGMQIAIALSERRKSLYVHRPDCGYLSDRG
jgi:hypothetical protein